MDYIQFTIAADRFDGSEAAEFWDWLVDVAAVDYLPAGGYTQAEDKAVFTLTVAGMPVWGAETLAADCAARLITDGHTVHLLQGIRYTDDDILTWEFGHEPEAIA